MRVSGKMRAAPGLIATEGNERAALRCERSDRAKLLESGFFGVSLSFRTIDFVLNAGGRFA
jgi:hypothetical protein